MIDKNELPSSWTIAKFEDLLDYIQPTEYIVASTEYDDKYKTPVLTAGKSFIKGFTNETNGIFNAVPVIIFDDFTTATQFVNFPFKVKSSAMKILKPTSDLVNIKLAFYFMQTVHLKSETHKRYWISEYSKLSFPIAPEKEQQRIFDKIEELITDLDKGIEYLETAQQQLKVYRQAVLKWAFEGKLTNKNVKDGELPKNWKMSSLGEIFESVKNGYGKKPDDEGSKKILRISSVRPFSVDFSDVRFLRKDLSVDYEIAENDLLFTRYNGSIEFVGVCGRVPALKEKIFYPDKLIRCRPFIKERFHAAYIEYAVNGGASRKFVLSKIKTTAGQTGISGGELKQVPIPLAPLKEQEKIVHEIERRISVCDKIEETLEHSLQQAESLRLSIIKKGFEGKLVKQNPKDESAEILLAKIRAEIKKNNPDKPEKEVKIKTSKKKKELA